MQFGFNEEARKATTEALVFIASDFSTYYLAVEAYASRAFLETTNAITFTDEDMEVQHPDHSRPLYIAAQINDVHIQRALVDTGASLNLILTSTLKAAEIFLNQVTGTPIEVVGSIQLVLRVGPIMALTRFHVIDSAVSYHALLGRPWLYRHKLVPSTYHQCVKGRFNDKPICIPANHTLFDLFEAYYFEVDFYDEFTPCGDDATSKPIGTPLLDWEVIEEEPKEYNEMPSLDPNLVAHALNVELGVKLVIQPMRTFHPDIEAQIIKEVQKLLAVGFIRTTEHPKWLSNIKPVKKKNGQIRCCVDF
nr:uncharacterized protein LOC112013895 [Quercus suber]